MLGSPQDRYPVVHVAGTKGKGSTVAMIAAVLSEAGYRVGRYMSPHVHAIEERICIDGRPIGMRRLAAALERVAPAVERMDEAAMRRGGRGPTWFEAVTAMAMVEFARQGVDVAVLETGLGGRLDATNVSRPLLSVITSVSLDHMAQLGRTVAAIAREKAGIIKRGCPVVSGAVTPAARRVVATTACRRRARLYELGRDFDAIFVPPSSADGGGLEPGGVAFRPLKAAVEKGGDAVYSLGMPGHHQAANAALAIAGVRLLASRGFAVDDAAMRRGLASVRLPARIEVIDARPRIVIDAAHNVASMKSLVATVSPAIAGHRPSVLVFAVSGDKQIPEMLGHAAGVFDELVLTRYRTNPRAATIADLQHAAGAAGFSKKRVHVAETPLDAIDLARTLAGRAGTICVAGSFFLASEVREACRRTERP